MSTISDTEFGRYSPEELSDLYKKDPARFDAIADAAINEVCSGGTPKQALRRRQLQWSIEARLNKAKTPAERMHIMEGIFYSRVFGAEGELAHLVSSCTELIEAAVGGDQMTAARGADQVPAEKPVLYLVKR